MRLYTRHVIRVAAIAVTALVAGATAAGGALTSATGEVLELNEAPQDVSLEVLTGTQALVFQERQCATLTSPLPVDVLNPSGTYSDAALGAGQIPAGTQVDTYYVHFDQPGNAGTETVTGTLTFDQPVIGLIFLEPTLDATDATVGSPGTTYQSGDTPFRGYEGPSDTVTVSPDGRTVTFTATVGAWQDELRIVTAGTCAPAVPTTAEQCKQGGWEAYGFRNQGQCVSFVVTGGRSGGPITL